MLLGSAVDSGQELKAFEMGKRVFDRHAVAVVKPVGPLLDEVERLVAAGFMRYLEASLGVVRLNTVVPPVNPYRQLSGQFTQDAAAPQQR